MRGTRPLLATPFTHMRAAWQRIADTELSSDQMCYWHQPSDPQCIQLLSNTFNAQHVKLALILVTRVNLGK